MSGAAIPPKDIPTPLVMSRNGAIKRELASGIEDIIQIYESEIARLQAAIPWKKDLNQVSLEETVDSQKIEIERLKKELQAYRQNEASDGASQQTYISSLEYMNEQLAETLQVKTRHIEYLRDLIKKNNIVYDEDQFVEGIMTKLGEVRRRFDAEEGE